MKVETNQQTQWMSTEQNKWARFFHKNKVRLLMALLPPALWAFFFLFIPYVLLFLNSFWKLKSSQIAHEFNLMNYVTIFSNPLYFGTLLKTLGIALLVTVLALIISYPLAYVIAFKVKQKWKMILYVMVIIPLWTSYLVRAFAWKVILGTDGILNNFLMWIGVIDQPMQLFLYSPFAVIITLTHIFVPFVLMPIYASLEHLNKDLIEASKDLGANRFKTFLHVVFPLSLPGVLAGCTMAFVLSMGDFIAPVLIGGPDGIMIANIVVSLFGAAYNWPLGSAIGIIILVLVIGVLEVTERMEKRYGSIAQR
ncbi:MAG: ABC transporter permease [Clostridia bacterium]